MNDHDDHDDENGIDRIVAIRIALVAVAVLASWLHPVRPFGGCGSKSVSCLIAVRPRQTV